jgi:dimethylsulfone monooxygenase
MNGDLHLGGGLAAVTQRITIFSTSHVPTIHPIVAAKQCVTVHHISNERFGLNLVMGWFTPEMEMFGAAQREHDEKYEYGKEWIAIVKQLWSDEEALTWTASIFASSRLRRIPSRCRSPYPVLVSAGNSPAGIDFSAREVDFNFMFFETFEYASAVIADLRRRSHGYGRDIGLMTYAPMICCDTEREAESVRREILDKGDWIAGNNS